ncbi:uncharacterized protein LOC144873485 [Branchiostoma floridae x Branchiostoma japonicum]
MATKESLRFLQLVILACISTTVVSLSHQEVILRDISVHRSADVSECYITIGMNKDGVKSQMQRLSQKKTSSNNFPQDEKMKLQKVTINKPATLTLFHDNMAVLDAESQKNVLWFCRDATQYLVMDEGK